MKSKRTKSDHAHGSNGDLKRALKEVIDERLLTYANGASAFSDKITSSVSQMIDAFDAFFTRNMVEDQPQAALALLEARLRSAREMARLLDVKIKGLEALRAKAVQEQRLASR